MIGPDAASYLQRMVSNDVEALGPGDACQALLLTAKARLIAPLTVLRRGVDDFLLLTEPALGDRVAKELVRFRFAAKCTIEREAHTSTIALGEPPEGSIPTVDYGVPAYELLDADPSPGDAMPAEDLERLRILAATPAWGRELDERVLPAEAGLEERAISFTKGCYPGQEPVARLHYRGHPNRGLRVLELEGNDLPAYDAELTLDGKVVGRITSAVHAERRRARARLRPSRGSRRRDPPPWLRPGDTATLFLPAPVAQGIERCPAEAEVARSNRAGRMTDDGASWPMRDTPRRERSARRTASILAEPGAHRRRPAHDSPVGALHDPARADILQRRRSLARAERHLLGRHDGLRQLADRHRDVRAPRTARGWRSQRADRILARPGRARRSRVGGYRLSSRRASLPHAPRGDRARPSRSSSSARPRLCRPRVESRCS